MSNAVIPEYDITLGSKQEPEPPIDGEHHARIAIPAPNIF
jgi:hypothetical protein